MTNKEIIEKKGVFIERAEPLTSEGIKAICMSDEDYDKYKAIQKALSIQKEEFEKMIEEIPTYDKNLDNKSAYRFKQELLTKIKEMGEK